jgi:NAD(P)-dependent dehydrogenase (short-subunit alcohol dehydrogenase family)
MNLPTDIDRIAGFVEEKSNSRLDVFIGNHGFALESAPLPDADLSVFSTVMNMNFMSMVRLTNLLPRFMTANSAIVFVSSLNSSVPSKASSSYCCSKAALTMLAKCAALDLGTRKIRVNSVAPGFIDTPFQSKFFPSPEEQTKLLRAEGKKAALGRIPSTQGITNAILFLASDLASDITGTEQVVDCGFAISWAG